MELRPNGLGHSANRLQPPKKSCKPKDSKSHQISQEINFYNLSSNGLSMTSRCNSTHKLFRIASDYLPEKALNQLYKAKAYETLRYSHVVNMIILLSNGSELQGTVDITLYPTLGFPERDKESEALNKKVQYLLLAVLNQGEGDGQRTEKYKGYYTDSSKSSLKECGLQVKFNPYSGSEWILVGMDVNGFQGVNGCTTPATSWQPKFSSPEDVCRENTCDAKGSLTSTGDGLIEIGLESKTDEKFEEIEVGTNEFGSRNGVIMLKCVNTEDDFSKECASLQDIVDKKR